MTSKHQIAEHSRSKTIHEQAKTGNVFVEFQQFGKSSGIEISEAMFHIYVIGNKYYLIQTVDLVELCEGCHIGYVKMSDSNGNLVQFETFKCAAIEI